MSLSRRDFLTATTATAAGTLLGCAEPVRSAPESRTNDKAQRSDAPPSANDVVRIGVIGIGVRGKFLIGNLPESARVVALCDCAESRIGSALEPSGEFAEVLQTFRDGDASQCATYQDYRKLIDNEDLDAVIIATPDHHHTLAAMMALAAGLDVYLEKPLTVSIREGRLLADAVQRTGRVLQVGSQQRTMEVNRFGCEFLKGGGLGRISKVELPNYPGPLTPPDYSSEPVPDGLAWDLFLGPTPKRPHNRKLWVKDEFKAGELLWRGWDLFRDYSGHLMTNWGAHSVDMVQYALGKDDTGPVRIESIASGEAKRLSRLWKKKTPAARSADERRFRPVKLTYADGVEVHFTGGPGDVRFYGERGTLRMRRNHFETDPPGLVSGGPDADAAGVWDGSGHVARPHLQNWLDCIRTREAPNAPVEVGHRSITVCHLANIARAFDRPLTWNPEAERFVDDAEADAFLDRPRRAGFELPDF